MSVIQAANTTDHVIDAEVTSEQGIALFDSRCRALLGVSSDEFLAAYDAGRYPDSWAEQFVLELEMLLPFAR